MFSKMRFVGLMVLLTTALGAVPQVKAPEAATPAQQVTLPAPQTKGKVSLEEVLARRRSSREFAPTALTDQELGQLLWAAQGITDEKGHRTAPSAMARYPLEIYVATAKGLFHYVAKGHALERITDKDIRRDLTSQASMSAPAVFVVTAEYARLGSRSPERAKPYVYIEAGHVAQNLLLQATALGLVGVPVGGFTEEQVKKAMPTPAQHEPVYIVPIGHPKQG